MESTLVTIGLREDSMICPVCRSDMIVVERNRIELDHCTNCGGVWFDSGELDLLLASFGFQDARGFWGEAIRSSEARTSEKPRRCPVCSQRMRKSNIGERPSVLIDACPRGDGIWFDGGELDQLLTEVSQHALAGPEAHRRITEFLGDMFRSRPRGQKS
jgi:uncharacterized protein